MSAETAARRYLFPFALAASVFALVVALVAEYAFGYEPCVLCVYQRIPYWTVVALALAALAVPTVHRAGAAALMAGVFAAGAVLALYHVGVEQHWWASAVCSGGGDLPASFEDFRSSPIGPLAKPCDAIDWTLFGLSMTVYNAIASAALAIISLAGARLQLREGR